jgi:hypothetical protein
VKPVKFITDFKGRGINQINPIHICSLGHCECDGRTIHKLSQRRLTADWLAPGESDSSRMHSKVSSDWLSSYIKATQPILEILKMAEYTLDSTRRTVVTPLRMVFCDDSKFCFFLYCIILDIVVYLNTQGKGWVAADLKWWQIPGFYPRPVNMGFLVKKVTMEQLFF